MVGAGTGRDAVPARLGPQDTRLVARLHGWSPPSTDERPRDRANPILQPSPLGRASGVDDRCQAGLALVGAPLVGPRRRDHRPLPRPRQRRVLRQLPAGHPPSGSTRHERSRRPHRTDAAWAPTHSDAARPAPSRAAGCLRSPWCPSHQLTGWPKTRTAPRWRDRRAVGHGTNPGQHNRFGGSLLATMTLSAPLPPPSSHDAQLPERVIIGAGCRIEPTTSLDQIPLTHPPPTCRGRPTPERRHPPRGSSGTARARPGSVRSSRPPALRGSTAIVGSHAQHDRADPLRRHRNRDHRRIDVGDTDPDDRRTTPHLRL